MSVWANFALVLWSTNTVWYLYSFWVLFVLHEVQLDNNSCYCTIRNIWNKKRKKFLKTSLFNEKWILTTAVEESLHTDAKHVPLCCALGYALQIEGILVKRQPVGQLCLCLQRANVVTLLVHTLLNLTNAYKHWSTKTVKKKPSSGGGRKLYS